MSMDQTQWVEDNNQYLVASLNWLRLRLEQKAAKQNVSSDLTKPASAIISQPAIPINSNDPNLTKRKKSFFENLLGDFFTPDTTTPNDTLPPPVQTSADDKPATPQVLDLNQRLVEATAAREAASQCNPPPALLILAQNLGLSDFARDTLLLCAAPEFDPNITQLFAQAQTNLNHSHPTFGLALSLFDNASWGVMSPDAALRYWQLVNIHQPGATPLTQATLRADERVVNYIKGLNHLDERLSPYIVPTRSVHDLDETKMLSTSQINTLDQLLWDWQQLHPNGAAVAQLIGSEIASKKLLATAAAQRCNRRLYIMNADMIPNQTAEIENLTRLWRRESYLIPIALYIEATQDSGDINQLSRFVTQLSNANALVMLGVRDTLPQLEQAAFLSEIKKPDYAEQYEQWAALLPRPLLQSPPDRPFADELSSEFSFNLPEISQVAQAVSQQQSNSSSQPNGLKNLVWEACKTRTRPRLDTLAQRLDAKATWDYMVLPDEPTHLLKHITSQVRHRGRVYQDFGFAARMNRGMGINALFAGESGTGKTMAAEVIANDLRLDLFRIDLSAVVSKYIGETEKNLRRLFDAAEDGGAILFFDEADALFGKRSEVKDSHDRFANIEINYLLQRIESFSGLAILATNMKTALDPAFMRRLRFIVNFPFPGVAERKKMWEKAFPLELLSQNLDSERAQLLENTPASDLFKLLTNHLDLDKLAKLNLTGGNIHSIALNAAFLVAQANTPLTIKHVLEATRMEFRKLGKSFNEADLKINDPPEKQTTEQIK